MDTYSYIIYTQPYFLPRQCWAQSTVKLYHKAFSKHHFMEPVLLTMAYSGHPQLLNITTVPTSAVMYMCAAEICNADMCCSNVYVLQIYVLQFCVLQWWVLQLSLLRCAYKFILWLTIKFSGSKAQTVTWPCVVPRKSISHSAHPYKLLGSDIYKIYICTLHEAFLRLLTLPCF